MVLHLPKCEEIRKSFQIMLLQMYQHCRNLSIKNENESIYQGHRKTYKGSNLIFSNLIMTLLQRIRIIFQYFNRTKFSYNIFDNIIEKRRKEMQINSQIRDGAPSISVQCSLELSMDIKYRPVEYLDARDHQDSLMHTCANDEPASIRNEGHGRCTAQVRPIVHYRVKAVCR